MKNIVAVLMVSVVVGSHALACPKILIVGGSQIDVTKMMGLNVRRARNSPSLVVVARPEAGAKTLNFGETTPETCLMNFEELPDYSTETSGRRQRGPIAASPGMR